VSTPGGGSRAGRFFRSLGPGLITGAADDDPSGISTYSVAGAAFGFQTLWTALVTFPLMVAVQLMCARLGLITGQGLAAAVRKQYPRWVLWGACALLLAANLFNISADLGGMGAAMRLVTGVDRKVWTPVFAALIIGLLGWSSYAAVARVLKFLALVLFAYVIAGLLVRPDWWTVLRSSLIPHIEWKRPYLAVLVAILGTNISPYLFFWQAAEEVEEDRAHGKKTVAQRKGAKPSELRNTRNDVVVGMLVSNLVMYFIVVSTAATLHARGITDIQTAEQAASALRPLAGHAAYLLFTLGIVGTGMLAVPVLAGSCAYALADAGCWRGASLARKPRQSPRYYAAMMGAIAAGVALDYIGLNPIKALFWSAILNGLLAPPLVVLIVQLTSDPRVMGNRVSPRLLRFTGWAAAVIMAAAGIAMLVL